MPRFAANLSMMYPELPFLDRFEAAAKDGFKAVEYLFPYAWTKEELAARLQAATARLTDDLELRTRLEGGFALAVKRWLLAHEGILPSGA